MNSIVFKVLLVTVALYNPKILLEIFRVYLNKIESILNVLFYKFAGHLAPNSTAFLRKALFLVVIIKHRIIYRITQEYIN